MDVDVLIELRISDKAELLSLQRTLTLVRDVRVERASDALTPNALGVADYLTAVGSSAGVLALIRTLPSFLRARRSDLSVEIKTKKKTVKLTWSNLDDIGPILGKLFDE